MSTNVIWFVITAGSALAVALAARTAEYATTSFPHASWRRSLTVASSCTLLLLLLAFVVSLRDVARLDGNIVALLVPGRGAAFANVMTLVTTMGDGVPSFILASVIALALYLRTHRWLASVVPIVVIVELTVQTALPKLFHDPTIADVLPHVAIGSAGPFPSGSVARLFAIFMVSAIATRHESPQLARAFAIIGPVLVLIEIATRLYLGRHLLIDIVGGLLLGILLTVLTSWLLSLASRAGPSAVQNNPGPGEPLVRPKPSEHAHQ